ncbi:MAG TPA: NERD domain-containing protein [Candidatus Angelobacter sp.]|nr:NERD domain-containing protein [Candidatus Angelobacter sp.]
MNAAEQFVYDLCHKSFLSLWSYMNPRKKLNGKELCDVIVVCDPDVIIFSVKHITMPKNGTPEVNMSRWRRRAIEESVAQLYGAERILKTLTMVIKSDSSPGIDLAAPEARRIHRIAVALGSEGSVGLPYGDFGKGFVHVLDEFSTEILLSELDTVTDFVKYLQTKQQFVESTHMVCEREEDLLAAYLNGGKKFSSEADVSLVLPGSWQQFQEKPEYQSKKAANQESYAWDQIIEILCHDTLHDRLEFSPGLSGVERSIRTMAREDRFSRRVLGKAFREFLDQSHEIRARMTTSPSGVVYVFLATPHGYPRETRTAELSNRCLVARGLSPNAQVVVGLATEQYTPGKGFSLDLVHMYKPEWTGKDREIIKGMQHDFGYFVKPRLTQTSEDEYPAQTLETKSSTPTEPKSP